MCLFLFNSSIEIIFIVVRCCDVFDESFLWNTKRKENQFRIELQKNIEMTDRPLPSSSLVQCCSQVVVTGCVEVLKEKQTLSLHRF